MASDFELAHDDFSAELDALLEMASASGSGGGALTVRARIAAGHGAVLLLAAMFEEYVRQQVRGAFRYKARQASDLSAFPNKIAAVVWRRSLEALARKPFEEVEANTRAIDDIVSSTMAFCLKKDLKADVSKPLSHNDNNMRSGEVNRLFNQIGLKSIISEVCGEADLVAFLGCDSAGKAAAELDSRFEDFFTRRNEIAHAIQLGSSSGPSELRQDIEMFRSFSRALAITLDRLLPAVAPAPVPRGRRRPAVAA